MVVDSTPKSFHARWLVEMWSGGLLTHLHSIFYAWSVCDGVLVSIFMGAWMKFSVYVLRSSLGCTLCDKYVQYVESKITTD